MRVEEGFLRIRITPYRDHSGVEIKWVTLLDEMGMLPAVVKTVVIRDREQKIYTSNRGRAVVGKKNSYIFSPNLQHIYRSFRMKYEGKPRTCVTKIHDGDIFLCRMVQDTPDMEWSIDNMRPYNPDNIDDMIRSSLNELGIRRVIGRRLDKEVYDKNIVGVPTVSIPYGGGNSTQWVRDNRIHFWSNEILTGTSKWKQKLVHLSPKSNTWLLVMNGYYYDLIVWDKYFDKLELMSVLTTIQCRKAMYGSIGYAPDSFGILNYPVFNEDCFRYPDRSHDFVPKSYYPHENWYDKYIPMATEKATKKEEKKK